MKLPITLKQNSNPYWGVILLLLVAGSVTAGILNQSYIASAVIFGFAFFIFLLHKACIFFYSDHFEIHYKLNFKSKEYIPYENIHKIALVAIPRAGLRLKIEFYSQKSELNRTHLEFQNREDIYHIFSILKNNKVNIVYTPEWTHLKKGIEDNSKLKSFIDRSDN